MNALIPLTLVAGAAVGAHFMKDGAPSWCPLACSDSAASSLVLEGDDVKGDDKKPVKYEVGSTIEETLALKDIDGKTHTMKDLRGKVVFIHFHSMHCPFMTPATPKIKQFQKDYAEKAVVVLAINANQAEIGEAPKETSFAAPYEELKEYVKENEVRYPICVDHGNKLSERFQARTTPHCYVIDAKGVLRYAGALDDDPKGEKGADAKNYVRLAVDSLLEGKDVETATTKPYGCSIKTGKK